MINVNSFRFTKLHIYFVTFVNITIITSVITGTVNSTLQVINYNHLYYNHINSY